MPDTDDKKEGIILTDIGTVEFEKLAEEKGPLGLAKAIKEKEKADRAASSKMPSDKAASSKMPSIEHKRNELYELLQDIRTAHSWESAALSGEIVRLTKELTEAIDNTPLEESKED
jgi:hypothetical protein